MKKRLLFTLLVMSLILVGCGKKKQIEPTKTTPKTEEPEITLTLGSDNYIFKGEATSCGDHKIQSVVTLTNEPDELGFKGTYEFYECNEGNVNLETSNGVYSQDGNIVTFVDSYGQSLDFEIINDNTITIQNQTFTK